MRAFDDTHLSKFTWNPVLYFYVTPRAGEAGRGIELCMRHQSCVMRFVCRHVYVMYLPMVLLERHRTKMADETEDEVNIWLNIYG